jgi:hypothetical protein
MSKTLNDCLKRALSKAKPVLDELGLPVYSAHINQLAHSLAITECDDDDVWSIVRILDEEASTLVELDIEEFVKDPRRRKVMDFFYRAPKP